MKFRGTDGGQDLEQLINLSNQLVPTYYKAKGMLYRIPGTNWGALERYSAEDGGWVDYRPFAVTIREAAVRVLEPEAIKLAELLHKQWMERVGLGEVMADIAAESKPAEEKSTEE